VADQTPNLDNIQGNIVGFNKDRQAFLFILLPPAAQAREWLTEVVADVATCREVRAFNDLFKLIRTRHHREGVVEATWVNVAFTHGGLRKLGLSEDQLSQFPEAFSQGMRSRADRIGDVGANAPASWVAGLGTAEIDGLLLVAADSLEDLHREVDHLVRQAARHGVQIVFEQEGETRRDAPGHEHFGFKDGISQPQLDGLTTGNPGDDIIALGECVLGHPRQGFEAPPQTDEYRPPPAQEPDGPEWATDGSYLVFRRLQQDVPAFQEFVQNQASPGAQDLFGSKLVGRYRSGAPLALANNSPTDPGITGALVDPDHINAFEYDNDPDGTDVPRAAHIRKVYPRKQEPPSEEEAEKHRILRRGIPFGKPFHRGARPDLQERYSPSPRFPHDRGLLFLSYQASIERQFEFIQSAWVNSADFPESGDGQDPIISQSEPNRTFHIPGRDPIQGIAQWVTTTGGEYFFQPSIAALTSLAQAGSGP
jgi:Dyp-type peroxidase family